jgi:hypothetical protein
MIPPGAGSDPWRPCACRNVYDGPEHKIAGYDKVLFYVRRPDGSNAGFNQMFATAPNTPYPQSPTDPYCWSGNCGFYNIAISQDTLLPSPNDQYYLDMFTPDRKYMGKSKLFYWKKD